jgi:hypothetical protein
LLPDASASTLAVGASEFSVSPPKSSAKAPMTVAKMITTATINTAPTTGDTPLSSPPCKDESILITFRRLAIFHLILVLPKPVLIIKLKCEGSIVVFLHRVKSRGIPLEIL